MAPAMATRRLREELIKLKTQPPPGIIAEPDESNILKWFYVIEGPTETPYEGGLYIGKLIFPSEYPMKAPSIHMLTPSGRFQINTQICMSMSNFHPESWNPMWSVSTIIQGIQSFMASDELTTGGMKASEADRKKFAKLSRSYNQKNYPKLFDGDIEAAMEAAQEACQKAQENSAKSGGSEAPSSSRRSRRAAKKSTSVDTETASEQNAEKESESSNNNGQKLSRRQRRLAQKAASTEQEQPNEDTDAVEDPENADASVAEITKELSAAEIEKRRKRNAKKRAKQKAKKAAASTPDESTWAMILL